MEKVKPFVVEKEEEKPFVVEEEEEELPLHGRKSIRTTTAISAGTNAGALIVSFNGDRYGEMESNLQKDGGNEHSDELFASKNPTVGDITNSGTQNLPAISSLQVPFSAKPHEKWIEYATPDTGTSQNGNSSLTKEIGRDVAEVHLEEVIKKPNTREFYCPHCNTCIQKVMLRDTEQEHTSAQCFEQIRCTSCFSFLVPAGRWPFSKPIETGIMDYSKPIEPGTMDNKGTLDVGINEGSPQQSSTTTTIPPSSVTKPDQNVATPLSPAQAPEVDSPSVFDKPSPPAASGGAYLTVPKEPDMKSDSTQPPDHIVIVAEKPKPGTSEEETSQAKPALHDPTQPTTSTESRSDYKVEIVKSIVYGGLIESITSLSVVTSAASAGATPLKIVALALANLIGGLFVMGQNLWELRSDEPAETSGTRIPQVDRYHVLLGNRNNFAIHIPVAVLSYLVFGLIPPVVYGFSFQKSNNTDFKLLAVAAASFICITILAIGKAAHIQNPPKYVYFRTILQYLLIGAMASGISYVAGDLVKKVMEKFGWLKSVAVTTPLPEMDSGTLAWASY